MDLPMSDSSYNEHLVKETLSDLHKSRSIGVPTEDSQVRESLRALGEPMTLFGEENADRRDRLRSIFFERSKANLNDPMEEQSDDSSDGEEYYVLGSAELYSCRKALALPTVQQSLLRLEREKKLLKEAAYPRQRLLQHFFTGTKCFDAVASLVGDNRPLSRACFSPDSKHIAIGSFSGRIQVWENTNEVKLARQWMAHDDSRVSGLDWHPDCRSPVQLLSSANDGSVHLWAESGENPICSLSGHDVRVARCKFHPFGQLAATTSRDGTWRLYDISSGIQLSAQDGHVDGVFGLGMHPDGSLLATGGDDGVGRVWDLRSGKCVMLLPGHVSSIYGIDFNCNGYEMVTGGGDNAAKIWDLRAVDCIYTLPAHSNIISECKFLNLHDFQAINSKLLSGCKVDLQHPENAAATVNGSVLFTSSFDGTCKLWTNKEYRPLVSLSANDARIIGADISGDGERIVTACYDKTFKVFSNNFVN